MSVTLRFPDGAKAVITDYRWAGAHAGLLNAMLAPEGPSGADPDPDLTAAQAAVKEFGAEITHADPPPESDPEEIN